MMWWLVSGLNSMRWAVDNGIVGVRGLQYVGERNDLTVSAGVMRYGLSGRWCRCWSRGSVF